MSRFAQPSARDHLILLVVLLSGLLGLSGRADTGGWHPVRLYRVDYVTAEELAGRYGLKTIWMEPGKHLRLQSLWTSIELAVDSREILWNGLRLFLSDEVVPYGKTIALSLKDVQSTLEPLLQPGKSKAPDRPRLIAIDAGHGGKDVGTQNRQLKLNEKTFTIDVARRLKLALEKLGFKTLLIRPADNYVSLESRPALANRAGADLFVSVHFNALANDSRVSGIETYSFTPAGQRSTAAHLRRSSDNKSHPGNKKDHWNTLLSAFVHRSLIEELGANDRGMKRARFIVLRDIGSPAVLVEGGFLSHPAEAQKIATPAYREQIAQAIAGGVQRYAELLEASVHPSAS